MVVSHGAQITQSTSEPGKEDHARIRRLGALCRGATFSRPSEEADAHDSALDESKKQMLLVSARCMGYTVRSYTLMWSHTATWPFLSPAQQCSAGIRGLDTA